MKAKQKVKNRANRIEVENDNDDNRRSFHPFHSILSCPFLAFPFLVDGADLLF